MIFDILRYAAPVGFASAGEAVSQRSGVINIGLEGTMLASALAATRVSTVTGNPWLGLLAAVVVGIVLYLAVSVVVLELGRDQVVVGTAVNLVSLGICGTLYEKSVQGSTQLSSLPALPALPTPIGKLDLMLIVLVALGIVASIALFKTKFGLRTRAAGEEPAALEAAGYNVTKHRRTAMIIGGLLAGLAGGYYAIGVAGSFAVEMIAGRGFVAIALVTFARWKPAWTIAAAALVGGLELLQYRIQIDQQNIPKSLLIALPYVVTLAILVVSGKSAQGPAALGKHYRGMR